MNILTNVLGGAYSSSTTLEYDATYVNEKGDNMRGNLNMKNNRILSLGEAVQNNDAVNKIYVDNKIEQGLTGLRSETTLTFVEKNDMKNYVKKRDLAVPLENLQTLLTNKSNWKLQKTEVENMLIYYNFALNYKPIFWISSKFPHGLFPKLYKIRMYDMFSDIIGHKVVKGLTPNIPDAIFAQNINIVENAFLLGATNQDENKICRITINYEFKLSYTFVFVTNKVLFTGTLPNRNFGWKDSKSYFKVGLNEFSDQLENTNLHCFIARCNNGIVDYWDNDRDITANKDGINFVVGEDFGKIVIGQPLHTTDYVYHTRGVFYELMLFDTALSNAEIESIKTFLKTYYNFTKVQKVKAVVDQSLLQNLN